MNPHQGWNEPLPPREDRDGQRMLLMLDYYQRAFALFHEELERKGYRPHVPHPIRERFWGLLPYREYGPMEGRELVRKYIESVERELSESIGKHSLAYWLHLYRRLSPGPIGLDKQPVTVGLVRATLEAAIQKYGRSEPCNGVGLTGDVPIQRVLGGILMAAEFDVERQALRDMNQLVLTDFTSAGLREFYDIERLAYEIWRSSAMLRIMAKGASIVVDDSETRVFDLRSDELDRLVRVFDSRNAGWDHWLLSSSGVVLNGYDIDPQEPGLVFLPAYNLGRVPIDAFESFFALFDLALGPIGPLNAPNFLWLPLNLRQYREAHVPFAPAFKQQHGVDMDAVLLVIMALCIRVFNIWMGAGHSLIRFWQRAYEGPYLREHILGGIQGFVTVAAQRLNLDQEYIDQLQLSKAMEFWELGHHKRSEMDLAYSGPHSVFLPYGEDRVFIDYAWIIRRLYSLFVGVSIPDQNFKGEALEHLVRFEKSVLRVRGCKSPDGEKRQIDAAFEVGHRLVIVECRATGKSIGFDRGNPDAVRFRNRVIERALTDIDQKPQWLADHPVGANYDISNYTDILPLAVTPFVEYIPSLRRYYWLAGDLPRVLTPRELKTALESGTLADVKTNTVPIGGTP